MQVPWEERDKSGTHRELREVAVHLTAGEGVGSLGSARTPPGSKSSNGSRASIGWAQSVSSPRRAGQRGGAGPEGGGRWG